MRLHNEHYIVQPPLVSWILVANRSEAAFFRREKSGPIELVERFANPDGRKHGRDLTTRRPGKTRGSSHGRPRHAYDEGNPGVESAVRFSRLLLSHLELAHDSGRFDDLVLVAEPRFLGLLRKAFPRALAKTPRLELPLELPIHALSATRLRGLLRAA